MKTISVLALLAAMLAAGPALAGAGMSFNGLGAKPPIKPTPMAGVTPAPQIPVLVHVYTYDDAPSEQPSDEPCCDDAPGGWEPGDGYDDPSDPPGGSDDPSGDSDGNPLTP